MARDFTRSGDRLCGIALGFMLSEQYRKWDAPDGAIPIYVAVGVLILAARWAVVARRNRRVAPERHQE